MNVALPAHQRLSSGEVAMLKHVVRRGGWHRPILVERTKRRPVPSLWRRNLIEVWYRQSVLTRDLQGPFYALTINGCRIVSTFDISIDASDWHSQERLSR